MTNLAIWASGTGSNAQAIIDHFHNNSKIKVALILSNRKSAGVLTKAAEASIQSVHFSKLAIQENEGVLKLHRELKIDAIILAGFLLKIPLYIINAYPDQILNIHPALLPKYGGKGMYGHHVHPAVYNNKDSDSGITIHLVNEKYDDGKILFQASTELDLDDQPEIIGRKVLELEHYYYPKIIEAFVENVLE